MTMRKNCCNRCGREFEHDRLTEFNGILYCSDCLEHETVLCLHCGERIYRNDCTGGKRFS